MYFFSFILFRIFLLANGEDPDQTHSAASDLGLHCLPMSRKWDARLSKLKALCRFSMFSYKAYVCDIQRKYIFVLV